MSKLKRLPDWDVLLTAEIERTWTLPYSWGECDCALWTCNMVKIQTGSDLAAWFRGRYHDEDGAKKAIALFTGGGNLENVAERLAREWEIPEHAATRQAHRGDVVCMDSPEGPTLGIALNEWALFAGPLGRVRAPLGWCRRAWSI